MSKTTRRAIRKAAPRQARKQLRRALKAVKSAAPPFDEDVHQARTALKNVRALLKLMRRGDKTRERLAKVARRVGRLRDAGVVIVTFDRVVRAARIDKTPSLDAVRARLEARRAALQTDPQTLADLAKAKKTLKQVKRRAERLLDTPTWPVVVDGLEASYKKARNAMAAAYRQGTDAAFHRWRKAVKSHAYQLRALHSDGGKRRGRQVDLDRLGDILGEAQDLAMFEETVRAERSCFDDQEDCRRLLHLLFRRRQLLRQDVRPLAENLFSERPRAFAKRLA